MKAKYIKFAKCNHCQMEYTIARSDQKFCSTSHRAANHSLKKRLAKKLAERNLPPPTDQPNYREKEALSSNPAIENKGYDPSFLSDIASSSIPYLLGEIIKSMKGVNNSDLMEAILKNQAEIIELTEELKSIKEELKVKNTKPDPPKSPPGGGVTLLN